MFLNRIHYNAYIVVSMWKHLFKLVGGTFHLLYNPRCFATVHTSSIYVIALERDGGSARPIGRERRETWTRLRKRTEGQSSVPTTLSVREYSCATYTMEKRFPLSPQTCFVTLRPYFILMSLTRNVYQLALSTKYWFSQIAITSL